MEFLSRLAPVGVLPARPLLKCAATSNNFFCQRISAIVAIPLSALNIALCPLRGITKFIYKVSDLKLYSAFKGLFSNIWDGVSSIALTAVLVLFVAISTFSWIFDKNIFRYLEQKRTGTSKQEHIRQKVQLQQDKQTLTTENEALKTQLTEQTQAKIALEAQKQDLEKRLNAQSEEKTKIESKRLSCEAALKALRRDLDSVTAARDQLAREKGILEGRLKEASAAVDHAKGPAGESLTKAEEERIPELESRLRNIIEELKKKGVELEAKEKEKAAIEEELGRLREELCQSQQQLKEAESRFALQQRELEATTQRLTALETELHAARERALETDAKHRAALGSLEENLKENFRKEIAKEKLDFERQLKELSSHLREVSQKRARVEGEVSRLRLALAEAEKGVREQITLRDEAAGALSAAQKERAALEAQLSVKTREFETTQAREASLRSELDKVQKDLADIREKYTKAEEEWAAKHRVLGSLSATQQASIDKKEKERADLQEKLKALGEEYAAALLATRQEHERVLADLRTRHETDSREAIAQANAAHEKAVADLRQQHEAEAAAHKTALAQTNAALNALAERLAVAIENIEASGKEASARYAGLHEEMVTSKTAHASALRELESRYKSQLIKVRAKLYVGLTVSLKKLEQAREDKRRLEKELGAAREADRKALQARIEDLSTKIEAFERSQKEKEAANNAEKAQLNGQFQKELAELQASSQERIARLSASEEALNAQVASLRSELFSTQAALSESQDKARASAEQLSGLTAEQAEVKRASEARIAELEQTLAEKTALLLENEAALRKARAELAEVNARLEALTRSSEADRRSWDEERATLSGTIASLKGVEGEKTDLQARIEALTASQAALEARMGHEATEHGVALQRANEAHAGVVAELTARQNARLIAELATLEAQHRKAVTELRAAQEAAMKEKIAELESLARAKEEAVGMQRTATAMLMGVESKHAHAQIEFGQELAKKDIQNRELESALSAKEQAINDLQGQITKLTQEREGASRENADSRAQVEALTAKLKELTEEKARLEKAQETLRAEHAGSLESLKIAQANDIAVIQGRHAVAISECERRLSSAAALEAESQEKLEAMSKRLESASDLALAAIALRQKGSEEAIAALRAQKAKLEAAQEAQKDLLAQKDAELERQQEGIEEREARLAECLREIEKLKGQIAELEALRSERSEDAGESVVEEVDAVDAHAGAPTTPARVGAGAQGMLSPVIEGDGEPPSPALPSFASPPTHDVNEKIRRLDMAVQGFHLRVQKLEKEKAKLAEVLLACRTALENNGDAGLKALRSIDERPVSFTKEELEALIKEEEEKRVSSVGLLVDGEGDASEAEGDEKFHVDAPVDLSAGDDATLDGEGEVLEAEGDEGAPVGAASGAGASPSASPVVFDRPPAIVKPIVTPAAKRSVPAKRPPGKVAAGGGAGSVNRIPRGFSAATVDRLAQPKTRAVAPLPVKEGADTAPPAGSGGSVKKVSAKRAGTMASRSASPAAPPKTPSAKRRPGLPVAAGNDLLAANTTSVKKGAGAAAASSPVGSPTRDRGRSKDRQEAPPLRLGGRPRTDSNIYRRPVKRANSAPPASAPGLR